MSYPYSDIRDFLAAFEREGDLRHVRVPVDPTLEATEIVTRVIREGGPALVFDRPTRGTMPLAMNVFGTERRMARALGVDRLDDIGDTIAGLLKPEVPTGFGGLREALG